MIKDGNNKKKIKNMKKAKEKNYDRYPVPSCDVIPSI